MSSDVEMKPKLEDVLFLKSSLIANTDDGSKLMSLSNAYENNKSNSNFKKLQTELNISKKFLNKHVTDEVLEKMIVDDLKGKFYPGFVKYFKSNYKDSLDKSMKNAQKSVEARIKANELFAKRNHDVKVHKNIWKLYSKSIAFGPVASKELILAYECRSNLLLHLKKYEDCMKDIDRALDITEFHLLKVKLLCRKMICFVAIGMSIDEKKNLWLSIKDEFEKVNGPLRDDKFLKMVKQAKNDSSSQPIKQTENVKGSSSVPLTFFQNVTLVHNKKRYMVANRDFVPGEEIIVTKPLVISTNPEKCYAYCSHCLSFMWAGIPCNDCSLCMYCSEECKAEAWEKYHILECKVLPHINFDDLIYFDLQTSIKVFILGLREFGSISKLKEEIDKLTDNPKLKRNDELYDSDFLDFYTQPFSGVNPEFLASYCKNACFLVAYMIETCDIFEEDLKLLKGKELSKKEDVVFCGLVMLKILLLCRNNISYPDQIYTDIPECTEGKCAKKYSYKRCCRKGEIFDPLETMFGKSCNPNVAGFWTDNGQMVYLCVQPIKTSEKILYRNSSEFFYSDRNKRDMDACSGSSLKMCKCDPCAKNWPTLTKLYKKFQQRQMKSEKKETTIVQKYLQKNNMKVEKLMENNLILNESEFRELAKEVNDVVKVCGQPSFASSFLISILCMSYEKLYGTIPLQSHIPRNC